MKVIYEKLACNWLHIKDSSECRILKKYAQRGKTIIIVYSGKYNSNSKF